MLAGCGGSQAVYGASTGVPAPTSQGLHISVTLSETASNVITAIGIAGLLAVGNSVMPGPPPLMKEDRTINEQDCTQPIVDITINLKCK